MKNTCIIVFLFCFTLSFSQEPVDTAKTPETSVFDTHWGQSENYLHKDSIILNTPFINLNFPPFNINQLLLFRNTICESHYNAKGAGEDIENNEIKILFFGKDLTFESSREQEFQQKYGVLFLSPDEYELAGQNKDPKGYNRVIFAYLDKKYGMKWRGELRKDAIGFETPKKIEPAKQIEASLQVIRVPSQVYSRFPGPTNLNEKRQLRIIKIVSVSLVLLLILYLLFRKRKSI